MFIKILTNDDVICGGSRIARSHPGNQQFERIINQNLVAYQNSSKRERSDIISTIITSIRNKSINGGFVQKDTVSQKYFVVCEHRMVRI
jgi:hypothetical protein